MSYPCQQLLTGRTCGVVLLAVAIITHSIPGGSSVRDCSINTNLLWSKDVLGLAPEAYAKLQPLLNYKFYLPDVELRAGLAYYGSARRLRNFVSELLAGNRPLKVGVVGGSISFGQGASVHGVTDWFSVVMTWLTSVSKNRIASHNGGIPATRSYFHVTCLDTDPDVDLLFVELCFNDGVEDHLVENHVIKISEQLLQRLLTLPGRPAVIFVQAPKVELDKLTDATIALPFYYTSEDLEGALASYYDIPTVSLRDAVYKMNMNHPKDGFEWNQLWMDVRPGDSGHKTLADLAVHLIQEAAIDLLHHPISEEEKQELAGPVPVPMYEGNLPPERPVCVTGSNFTSMVRAAEGFKWVNEGTEEKQKWGYVATVPGSSLLIPITLETDEYHAMFVHYLQSYTDMGIARIDCVTGCTCAPTDVNAWQSVHNSQTALHHMTGIRRVKGATECNIRVTVLNETTTAGHKFKVSGVVMIAQAHI